MMANEKKDKVEVSKADEQRPPQNYVESLQAVLLEVPKAAQKAVTEVTAFVAQSMRAHAHNTIELGKRCSEIRGMISKAAFARWVGDLLPRIGASTSSVYRWMGEAETLKVACGGFDTAIEALVVVTGARGLFAREDGEYTLTGAFTAALKAFPVPAKGTSYEACLDWGRNLQVKLEQGSKGTRTPSELYKAGLNLYGRILKRNVRIAAEFVVACYRAAANLNEQVADAIEEGISNPSLSLDEVGKLATAPPARKAA